MLNLFGKELRFSGALALLSLLVASIQVFLTISYLITGAEVFASYDITILFIAISLGLGTIGTMIWESKKAIEALEAEE